MICFTTLFIISHEVRQEDGNRGYCYPD